MNFGLDLNLHVGLEQRLSPQMIQSLKLLQMNSMELETVIKQELEANPMLESTEDAPEEEGASGSDGEDGNGENGEGSNSGEAKENSVDSGSEGSAEGGSNEDGGQSGSELDQGAPASQENPREEIDWEKYFEEGFDHGEKHSEEFDASEERFERVPVYAKTLQDHLLAQLADRELDPQIKGLVEYLIGNLDERGYLMASPPLEGPETPNDPDLLHAEILEVLEGKKRQDEADIRVREAFHVLQSFEPAGVGARNLRECLLLQIQRFGKIGPLGRRIIEEDFDLLERLKIAAIARKYDCPPEDVQAALKEIGTLEPLPGRQLSAHDSPPVIPDLLVEEIEGELVLLLNDRNLPHLRVSRAYARLLQKGSKASADEKKFVREKLNSATWLIRAIEQRKGTMLRVMQAIIESQPEFFKVGATQLRPLILQDIADKIGMHISTVSRVTNGKYVQTPHGIFELKYFFSAGVMQADGSEVSSVMTKDEIKQLIVNEDSHEPLSDQRIVEILKAKGLDVARRTVAKYRDQLEILPARLRKKY